MFREKQSRGGRSMRWRRKCFLTLMFAAILLLFLPSILATNFARRQLLTVVLPELASQVEIGDLSLGWLSPVRVQRVTIADNNGRRVLTIDQLSTDKCLLELVTNRHCIGRLTIDRPVAHLVIRPDGSNLEDVLRPIAQRDRSTNDVRKSLELVIRDGSLTADQDGVQDAWTVSDVEVSLIVPNDGQQMSATVSANVAEQDIAGEFRADAQWSPPLGRVGSLGQGNIHVIANRLSLSVLQPLLRGYMDQAIVSGKMNTNVRCTWDESENGLRLTSIGDLSASQLCMTLPTILHGDQLKCDHVNVSMQAAVDGDVLKVNDLSMQSDLGDLRVAGTARLSDFASPLSLEKLGNSHPQYRIDGRLSLSRMAEMFPNTLRIRTGSRVTSGELEVRLTAQPHQQETVWEAGIKTSQVVGEISGRPIQWQHPLDVSMRVSGSSRGFVLETLSGKAPFFELSGQDDGTTGLLSGTADLTKLADEFAPLIDLHGLEVAGNVAIEGQWRRNSDSDINLAIQLQLAEFELAGVAQIPLREELLAVQVSANGRRQGLNLVGIDSARASVTAGQDQLFATLREPITIDSLNTTWPIDCELRGQLSRWERRLNATHLMTDRHLEGRIDLRASVTASRKMINVQEAQCDIAKFQMSRDDFNIREPRVRLKGTMTWDRLSNALTSEWMTMASTSVSLRADDLRIQLTDLATTGSFGFRGKLDRVWHWIEQGKSHSGLRPSGQFLGRLHVTRNNNRVALQGQIDVEPFHLLSTSRLPNTNAPIWLEPRLVVKVDGRCAADFKSIEFSQFELVSPELSIISRGKAHWHPGRILLDIDGTATCQLEQLSAKLRPLIGDDLQFGGRREFPFKIQGPIGMAADTADLPMRTSGDLKSVSLQQHKNYESSLEATARVGWDWAMVYGMRLGPANLAANLRKGVISTEPVQLSLSQGQIRAAPRIDFGSSPVSLSFDGDVKAENVHLTPGICHDWIKYVAPLLADVTRTDGQLSVVISDAWLPLTDLTKSRLNGTLKIHAARVLPGPLAVDLLSIVRDVNMLAGRGQIDSRRFNSERPWLEMPAQDILFAMHDGRVEHRGVQLMMGDVSLRTHGWVGIDQTLSVMAEVPIRDQWIAKNRWLGAVRGRSIQIPISGSLGRPRIDRRGLSRIVEQTATSAAQSLLQHEIENRLQGEFHRQLEKLFQPGD